MSVEEDWQHDFIPDEAYVAEGLPPEGRAELDGVIRGLLDLAALRMEAGNDYDEQNPRRLRSVSTDRLIAWYQKFEHRKRLYIVRVTWFG